MNSYISKDSSTISITTARASLLSADTGNSIHPMEPFVLLFTINPFSQDLMITRTVNNTKPVTVSYVLAEYTKESEPVIYALIDFGPKHRKR